MFQSILVSCGLFFSISLFAIKLDFIDDYVLPKDLSVDGVPIHELSGIAYDSKNKELIAVSDDSKTPSLFAFTVVVTEKKIGVVPVRAIAPRDKSGKLFGTDWIDMEGIVLTSKGELYISSEGRLPKKHKVQKTDPAIFRLNAAGVVQDNLSLPPSWVLAGSEAELTGVRSNKSLESLSLTPDEQSLFTALEGPLIQDGSLPDFGESPLTRILKLVKDSSGNFVSDKQFAYRLDAVPNPSGLKKSDTDERESGLAELLAIDNNGHFLALERSFVEEKSGGKKRTVKVYEVDISAASDVSSVGSLKGAAIVEVSKKLVLDFDSIVGKFKKGNIEQIEGMCWGPVLPSGKKTVIFVSDDNGGKGQRTQFVAVRVE